MNNRPAGLFPDFVNIEDIITESKIDGEFSGSEN
jgi:hypothetical protein